jgi:hypothetical protein
MSPAVSTKARTPALIKSRKCWVSRLHRARSCRGEATGFAFVSPLHSDSAGKPIVAN